MRRLARGTLNAFTVLSLLLCVATAVLWACCRAGAHSQRIGPSDGRRLYVRGEPNLVTFTWIEPLPPALRGQPAEMIALWQRPKLRNRNVCRGVSVIVCPVVRRSLVSSVRPNPAIGTAYGLDLSYGWLLGGSAALPACTLTARIRRRRRHRYVDGCCVSCGYDLTGNVSGVCPECGTKVAAN